MGINSLSGLMQPLSVMLRVPTATTCHPGPFWGPPTIETDRVTLGAVSSTGAVNGDGTLATLTFEVLEVRESTLALSDVILIKSDGGEYSPLLSTGGRVIRPTLSSSAVVSVMPSRVLSPAIRQQLVFDVGIAGGKNVVDHQLTWEYDKTALKFISSSWGNYIADGVGNGDGVLFTGTFEVLSVKDSTVNVSGHFIHQDGFRYIPTFESAQVIAPPLGDVNRDGVVNILDLVLVASSFGQRVQIEGNPADVNEDGIVSIVDLVRVAGALDNAAAAPSFASTGRDTAHRHGRATVAHPSTTIGFDRCNIPKRDTLLRTTFCNFDTERDSTFAELSKPLQSRNVDSVSIITVNRCHHIHSFC